MSTNSAYDSLAERLNWEYVLLSVMVVTSGYMFWKSFEYGSAGLFPRFTSGTVLVGSLLLAFREYLPKPVYNFVAESADVIDVEDEFKTGGGSDSDESDQSVVDRPLNDSLFTVLAICGYALLGYAISILAASPVFIIVYCLWFRQPWYVTAVLAVLSVLICFGFMTALNIPLNRGEFLIFEVM